MATITLRSAKGSPLTNAEVDDNFSNLNTELGQKESASNKGQASGYASLDGSGKVPASQLPSYVDDVVEAANFLSLPGSGETGKIYVVLDTNKSYRWSGSAYIEIASSPGSTDAIPEGSTNLYFTNARARSSISASGSLSYNSSTGVLSYTAPTAVSQLSNDSGYITSSALSSYLPLSGGTMSGAIGMAGTQTITFAGFAGVEYYNAAGTWQGYIGTENNSGNLRYNSRLGTHTWYANSVSIGSWNSSALNSSVAIQQSGNQVLHAANYTSYSPSLTGSGASGTWAINITGNTSGATLPQYYGTTYNWNGTAVQHYWTRIANVTGADGWAFVLVTTKQDVNYVPAGAYLLSIARFNNISFSVKVDAINSHDTNLLVRIDNSGGVWVKASVEWNSQKAWRVIDSFGENVMYSSFNSETLSTPANSIELSPGQQVRGTQGAATSASVATSQNRFGSIDSIGTIAASGAITQGGNQVLHAGNYSSYALPLSGGTLTGSRPIEINTSGGFIAMRGDSGGWSMGTYFKGSSGTTRAGFGALGGGDSLTHAWIGAGYENAWMTLSPSAVNATVALQQGGNQVLHAGNSSDYQSRSIKSARTSNVNFNSLNTAQDTFAAGTNYIPNGGAYNQPADGDHHYLSWGGIEGSNVWGAQIDINFYDDRMWFRRQNGADWQAWRNVLHDGNYTSYSPSLTGSGASGTWGISITGNAATAGGRSIGLGAGEIPYLNGSKNLSISDPESHSGEVRLGAAWNRGGLYGSNGVTVSSGGSFIDHVHSNITTMRHIWNNESSRLAIGRDVTTTPYTLIDGNQRPGVYIRGSYPFLTLDGTATSNGSHGPTLQFVHDNAGSRQWVVGTNGTGTRIDFGYSDSAQGNSNYNAHNGISGYNGTTWMTVRNNGRIGLGWAGDWGDYGTVGEPSYPFHFVAGMENGHSYLFRNTGAVTGSAAIFVNSRGDHSYGIVGEFRIDGTAGTDRPSILFSTGYNSDTWSVGFGSTDSEFRIKYDHGHRNSGWGTEAFKIDRSKRTYIHQGALYQSGDWNSAFNNTPVSSRTFHGDVSSGGPTGTWWFYDSMRHSNSSNYWGTQIAYGWEDNANNIYQRNVTGGSWSGWVRYLNSSNYASYAINRGGDTVSNIIYYQSNRNTTSDSCPLQAYSNNGSGATMSFHRGGYYAVNFGLDSDNVMRIGGWSAGANRWQLDMSGNGTYAGNVTAYSDERLKKDWSPIEEGFVDRLAGMLAGTYTRIDSGERQAGVSAQKMREILPEVVSEDNEGTLALAYGNAAMVSAVELAKELVMLKKELAEIKSRLH